MVKCYNSERTEGSPFISGILSLVKREAQIWLLGRRSISDKLRGLLMYIIFIKGL